MSQGDAHREFIDRFRSATLDRLERLTLALLELERNPDDEASAAELLRDLHTLKGEAKMMGFADINLVAHRLEDLTKWAADRQFRVPQELHDIVLTGFDTIGLLVQKSANDGDVVDLPSLMSAIEEFLSRRVERGEKPPVTGTSEAPPAAMPSPDSAAISGAISEPIAAPQPSPTPAAETDEEIAPPKPEPPSKDMSRVLAPTDEPTRALPYPDEAEWDDSRADAPLELRDLRTASATGKAPRGTTTKKIRDSSRYLTTRTDEATIRVELERLDTLLTLTGDLILSHERSSQRVFYAKALRDILRQHMRELGEVHRQLPHLEEALGADWNAKHRFGNVAVDDREGEAVSGLSMLVRSLFDSGREMLSQLERLLRDLRDDSFRERHQLESLEISVRELRLLPIGTLFRRYPRAVRDLAKEQEKQISVLIHGENVELDKRILDQISEPLLHLIRNAVDHGIEFPGDRVAQGKSPEATLSLTARHVGAAVEIEVADNGRGINLAAVKRVAVERSVLPIEEADRLSHDDALELIFAPGFSTSAAVSQLSGRGVGLDVVRQKIEDLGGTVQVHSEPGVGTRFVLLVPVRVAIAKAQIVKIGQDRFAIPADEIEKFTVVAPADLEVVGTGRGLRFHGSTVRDGQMLRSTYEVIPVSDLARLINMPPLADTEEWRLAIINHGGRRLALRVDDFIGEQEIVRRPFDVFLAGVTMFSGTTILPDGGIAPILNIVEVMRVTSDGGRLQRLDLTQAASRERDSATNTILIVEDSEITRELIAEILRGKGFRVNEARHGVEGLEQLAIERPDLVITDIDMPEMNGFEMLEQLRAQPEFYNLPVVVLTTRGGDEDKRRALSLGANAYLVKTEFQEDNLADTVDRLLGRNR